MRTLVALFFAAATVSAQVPARDPAGAPPPRAGTASVSGAVTDEARRPVRRATVTASGPSGLKLSAVTDESGRFVISDLPAGRFTITAKKAGSPSVSYGANRPNRPGAGLLLVDGQQVTGLALTLARGGVLSGSVVDEYGRPMAGVPMMAWEVRVTLAGNRTLAFPSTGGVSVMTDDRGMYRIFGLPPGEYTVGTSWSYSGTANARIPTDVEIRAAFAAAVDRSRSQGTSVAPVRSPAAPVSSYVPIFYPSATDPLVAQTVELKAGEERDGLDIQMQRQPAPTLEATVVGPDGGPVERAEFRLARRSAVQALNSTRVGWTQPRGRIDLGSVAPGDYVLRVDARATPSDSIGVEPPAGNPTTLWAIADISLATAPVTVTLQLQPAMTLSGRVAFNTSSTPLPADPSIVRVSLAPPADSAAVGSAAKIAADGTFTLPGVTPGRFRVTANVPATTGAGASPWVLESVGMDGRDVTDQIVEIGPGEIRSLVVTFTDRVAELTGTITNAAGTPLTDYFVIVAPADRQYWTRPSRRIVNTRPDVGGRFTFRGLPPGDYRIAVTTDLVPDDLADGNALQQLMLQAVAVTVGPGERKVFDIRTAQ